ncbi:MAG: PHP domain-containing protein [Candidatus Methanoperedens sp.]|nr:PHP domain-containing protein [Candidatus Methanoperedens sp.]
MRFDLHIHSNHSSDSNLKVDDILKKAIKAGLDGIAICDHNTVTGSYLARKRVRDLNLPLIVIPGIEVSTKEGHLLILGIRENIPPGLTAGEAIRIARKKGGLAVAAHPFKKKESVGNIDGIGDMDAIETFNSRCIFGENAKAKELARALHIPEVGGSDSHLLATIGLGYTDIDAEPDEKSVLSAIREGRTSPGGKITPVYIVFILILRGAFRELRKVGKKIGGKIFQI